MRCPKCGREMYLDIQGDSYSHYVSDSDNRFRADCYNCDSTFVCKMQLVSVDEVHPTYWRTL